MKNMITTKPMIDPQANPNSMLLNLWRLGQKDLARATEKSTRESNPNAKIYSLACEEWLDKYIGDCPSVLTLKENVRKLAIEDDPVLIIGPSGTGKELIARALHGSRNGKFEAINCTALPSELIESELFGHEKGAFTGAVDKRLGKFVSAWGGTLFLDEIGDMPLLMQAKLLRVLQEKEVTPLGSDKITKINCRVVAATNRTLAQLRDELHFRDDLFWRLSTFTLYTKSISERLDDFHSIMDYLGGEEIMNKFDSFVAPRNSFEPVTLICNSKYYEVFGKLEGNVRQLQSIIRRYKVLGELPERLA